MQRNMHLLTYPPPIPQQEENAVTPIEDAVADSKKSATGTPPLSATDVMTDDVSTDMDQGVQSWLQGAIATTLTQFVNEEDMRRVTVLQHATMVIGDRPIGELLEVAEWVLARPDKTSGE